MFVDQVDLKLISHGRELYMQQEELDNYCLDNNVPKNELVIQKSIHTSDNDKTSGA